MIAFVGLPGGVEWLVILIIALLIFGSRLPSVMRSLGKSINEFKRGMDELEDEGDDAGEPVTEKKEKEHSDLPG